MRKEEVSAIKAGIFVVMCLAVMVLAIIALGKRTQIFARQYKLTAEFQNAGGLIRGAAVRVAGVNAGNVSSVEIVPGTEGKGVARVVLNVGTAFKQWIRKDSIASISTLGILGDKYVEISAGAEETPMLDPGSQIATVETVDISEIATQARGTFERVNRVVDELGETLKVVNRSDLAKNLQASSESLRRLLERVEQGPSLIHSAIYDPGLAKLVENLNATSQSLRQTMESVDAGKGNLGELVHGEKMNKLIDDLAQMTASAKAIMKQLETGDSVAHALIYSEEDRKALAQLGQTVTRLNDVMAKVQQGQGTLGLLIADPTVWESFRRLFRTAEESVILRHYVEQSAAPAK